MRLVKGIWKLLVGVKDFLVLIFMLMFFGLIYALLSISPNPAAPVGGALLVNLEGSLVEQPQDVDPISLATGNAPANREYRLRDVTRAIRSAATDSRIKAVVLDLDRFTGGGQATISEAAKAIDAVRLAGKPVLAYATGYTDDGYQLAAHASEVWLNPMGAVLIAGPGGTQLYYKGLLDKLGVNAHIYRVGEFKSAVEPFIRNDQSPEARAANQALANSLWQTWQDEVGKARSRARIASYVADPRAAVAAAGGNIAQAALGAALVDRLGDRLAFSRRVAELVGPGKSGRPDDFQNVSFAQWVGANPERSSGGNIGVVTIAGEIVDGRAGPGTAAGDTISHLIFDELNRNRIKALVVRVDSPGGSVSASEQIRAAILAAKAKKLPIVVSMGSIAASGGYWVSMPADRIFAEPATITGSIGVFGIIPTFEGSLQKLGLGADGVKTTPLSGEPDVLRGTSPQFDALVQLGVEDIYRYFTGIVAASRKLPVARVEQIAEGRVWAGSTAKDIGLVDQFGSLDEAIADAARRAKIDPAQARPIFIEREPSAIKALFARFAMPGPDERETARDPWTKMAQRPHQIAAQAIQDALSIASGPAIQVRCLECVTERPLSSTRLVNRSIAALVMEKIGL